MGLLASSSQPGLDTCLLHFLPHWGWGRQLQYELCSHWGLGETWLEENSNIPPHPYLPRSTFLSKQEEQATGVLPFPGSLSSP